MKTFGLKLNFKDLKKCTSRSELFNYVAPIVVEKLDPLIKKIVGTPLVYYNIHFWSYRFGKRIGEVHLPEGINKDPHFIAMHEVFLKKTKRGNFNQLFFQTPSIKKPFVLIRGTLNDIKDIKEDTEVQKYKHWGIILPDEIFLTERVRNLSSLPDDPKEIGRLLIECMNFAISNSESKTGNNFWVYFKKKIEIELGYDVSEYYDKNMIFEMFSPILARRDWKGMYFIPCELIEGTEVGVSGLYVFAAELLDKSIVDHLRRIINLTFGRLAHQELKEMDESIKERLNTISYE